MRSAGTRYVVEGGWSVRARPDWQVAYAYDRWRPTLFAAYSDDTDGWREGEVRTREVEAGALLSWRRVRSVRSMLASLHVSDDHYECAACEEPIDAAVRRTSGRGGVAFSNAHQFGYSISAEEGGRLTATAEGSRGRVRGTSSDAAAGNGARADRRRALLPAGRGAATMCSPFAPPPRVPGEMTPPRNCSALRVTGRSPPASASASTPSVCCAASTRTPSSAPARRWSMSITACRCGGSAAASAPFPSSCAPCTARCSSTPVRRGRTASAGAMPGRRSAASFPSIRWSALACRSRSPAAPRFATTARAIGRACGLRRVGRRSGERSNRWPEGRSGVLGGLSRPRPSTPIGAPPPPL